MTATQTPGGDNGDDWKWPLCKYQALGSSGNLFENILSYVGAFFIFFPWVYILISLGSESSHRFWCWFCVSCDFSGSMHWQKKRYTLDVKSDFEAFLSFQLETVEDIYREFYNQVFHDGSNCIQLYQWNTTLILNTSAICIDFILNTEDVIVIWLWTGGLWNGVREVASADHE